MTQQNDFFTGLTSYYQEIKYNDPLVILKNPKTELYNEIKTYVNSENIAWYFNDKATNSKYDALCDVEEEKYDNLSFFSHAIINRPLLESPVPKLSSYDADKFITCVNEILQYNNFHANCMYRLNVNMTFYSSQSTYTLPHVDHDFPHNNLLIYFNEFSGGEIKVYKDKEWHIYKPEEDDVVLFSGLHCHRPPQQPGEFRKILVTTFI